MGEKSSEESRHHDEIGHTSDDLTKHARGGTPRRRAPAPMAEMHSRVARGDALSLELGRQDDRGRRALHAVESTDSVDDLIHLVHRSGHGNRDQIDIAAYGVQHAHLVDGPKRGCDRPRFLRSDFNHDMRAHRAHSMLRRKPDAITHDHALLLGALDATLHAGTRAADQPRQLRGRRAGILPQRKNQLLVDGVHAIYPFYPTYCHIIPLIMTKITLPFAGLRWENTPP